jgi:DNA-binding GntR family transcriptional regulator
MLNSRLMGLVEIAGGLSYRDGSREPVVAQHLELIEAMAGGDPARARAAVDDHVRTARESAAQLH